METELSSKINENSNNIKNINIVQSTNQEATKKENTQQLNNESSQSYSNEAKGASPKLFEPQISTDGSNATSEEKLEKDASPGDCQYFFEDEIFHIDKRGHVKFGLVVETPGTYSGDEDDGINEIVNKGEIRVFWYPEYKESIQSENVIGLADRSLIPGDVVRKNEGQRGYCRDINMKADVKVLGTKYVIKNVNAERLRVISNWQRDGTVCFDSWVGSIKEVEEKAILKTASGCRIEISSQDFYYFEDLKSRVEHDEYYPKIFYPGNTIIGTLPPKENIKILTPDVPLHTNKKAKPLSHKFIIENLYTDRVWVNWQCKALSDETDFENITHQPDPCISGDDLNRLKRINLFESCMLQIADRSYLTYSTCDTLLKKSDWDRDQKIKFRDILKQQKEENKNKIVRTSFTGPSGTSGTHHHYDKLKKKLSLSLEDKASNKLKRSFFKGDKLGKRESSQEMPALDKCIAKADKYSEAEWFSTEDEEEGNVVEYNCNVIAMDVDSLVVNPKQYEEGCISTTTAMSTCSSSSSHTSPKHLTKRQLKRKVGKHLKKPCLTQPSPKFEPKEGDELVAEALLVYSTATVVWQDGTIETDIPSTQLYPIHHLDNHEFFPGDFVMSAKEDPDVNHRDYGVIQTVDHDGRIARVKWFTTYTSTDEPKPAYKGESECSVYDLKDQPDFTYRPGTMVIRVANFVGEDAKCTAGQVIDNCTDGRVNVWWVDGHISLCWPQDLFEVGQLEEGEISHASDDSWETESENSEFGGNSGKLSITDSDILINIEMAHGALARLEEIFNISPNLQNQEVMRKLLVVYKSCRFFDRLLNTNFFHEDHFMGLIERARKVGTQSMQERVHDQKNRLFGENIQGASQSLIKQHIVLNVASIGITSTCSANGVAASAQHNYHQSLSQQEENLSSESLTSKDFAPRILFSISLPPSKNFNDHNNSTSSRGQLPPASFFKMRSCPPAVLNAAKESQRKRIHDVPTATIYDNSNEQKPVNKATHAFNNLPSVPHHSPNKIKEYNFEKNQLLSSVMTNIEEAFEKTHFLTDPSIRDLGNYSRHENAHDSTTSYDCTSFSNLANVESKNSLGKISDNEKSISQSNCSMEFTEEVPTHVCVRLCLLLKEQLIKCLLDIKEKYKDGQKNLSTIMNIDSINNQDEDSEAVIGIEENKVNVKSSKNEENVSEPETVSTHFPKSETNPINPSSQLAFNSEEAGINVFNVKLECFQILSSAPKNHKYQLTFFHPNNTQQYYKAVQRELRLLKTSLPPGVYVKGYEERMDLLSVMIEGPKRTPYEDGMFFFDIQLGCDYPKRPPLCHYISYCSDRLNPNLYEEGKVCVSLLGTWMGKDTEMWGPNSTLLQVIVSIQGLILVPEPYFNEAGYEKQKGTQQGNENSRMYNEMVIIKLIQATTRLIQNPPEIFRDEVKNYFNHNGLQMYERIKGWMELSKKAYYIKKESLKHNNESNDKLSLQYSLPDFPLVPASRGFCLTLESLLENFKHSINSLNEIATNSTTTIE